MSDKQNYSSLMKLLVLVAGVCTLLYFILKKDKPDIPQFPVSALQTQEIVELDRKTNNINEKILTHYRAIDSLIAARDKYSVQVSKAERRELQKGLDTLFNFERYPQ